MGILKCLSRSADGLGNRGRETIAGCGRGGQAARGTRSAPFVWFTGLGRSVGRSARQDTGGGLQEGPRPQMRLGAFCIRLEESRTRGAYPPISQSLRALPTFLLQPRGTSGAAPQCPQAHCPFTSLCQPFPEFRPHSLQPSSLTPPYSTPPRAPHPSPPCLASLTPFFPFSHPSAQILTADTGRSSSH